MRKCVLLLLVVALALPSLTSAAVPNSWEKGSWFGARAAPAAATLTDGRFLVSGGEAGVGRQVQMVEPQTELFDPGPGRWQATPDIPEAGPALIALTPLSDGGALAVYVRYVTSTSSYGPAAARFDPVRDSWRTVATPPASEPFEALGSLVTLADGRVLVLHQTIDGSPSTTLIYDPAADSWTKVSSQTRSSGPLTLLADRRVLAVGGVAATFDLATGAWTDTASSGAPAAETKFTQRLPSGEILVAWAQGLARFDPGTGEWSHIAVNQQFFPVGVRLLPDGRVFAPGAQTSFVIDLQRERVFSAARARYDHRYGVVASLPDGRTLVGGGVQCSAETDPYDNCYSIPAVELYTPPPPRPVVSETAIAGSSRTRWVGFQLNEAADVRLALERRTGARWQPARSGKRQPARAGHHRIRLAGRLDLRRLPPGRYRVRIFSRDPFDRTGVQRTVVFRLAHR